MLLKYHQLDWSITVPTQKKKLIKDVHQMDQQNDVQIRKHNNKLEFSQY